MHVASRSPFSTSVLLTWAAIGVAAGILGGIAGWVTVPLLAWLPIMYGFVLGVHVLPGIIAQEVLRMPWVALLAHALAALVGMAIAPIYAWQYIGTALLFGGVQELVAAAVRYRSWAPWRFFISAIVIGFLVAAAVYFAADVRSLEPWAQIVYLVMAMLGPVAWTAIGLGVGAGLRRAGIGPRTRA